MAGMKGDTKYNGGDLMISSFMLGVAQNIVAMLIWTLIIWIVHQFLM